MGTAITAARPPQQLDAKENLPDTFIMVEGKAMKSGKMTCIVMNCERTGADITPTLMGGLSIGEFEGNKDIAAYLGLVHTLRLQNAGDLQMTVYCNSAIAMEWVKTQSDGFEGMDFIDRTTLMFMRQERSKYMRNYRAKPYLEYWDEQLYGDLLPY